MAEVPVTARIRRKPVEFVAEVVEPVVVAKPPEPIILPHAPKSSFRQRVARGRQADARQMRLW